MASDGGVPRVQALSPDRRRMPVNPGDEPLQNRLLAALPTSDLDLLKSSLHGVDLGVRQVLESPGQPILDVCFL